MTVRSMAKAVDCAHVIEGKGPPLLMVHGIGARKTSWAALTRHLKNDFTCIAYDLRGHGESPMGDGTFGLDELVADLEALRNMRSPRANLETLYGGGPAGSPYLYQRDDPAKLLVNGGDPLYLCYWMRQSGLADLFPSLRDMVYVGLSAGSMIMAPNIGEDFVIWTPPTGGDETLGVVDFAMFPHLDHEKLPDNTLANAEKWAARIPGPAYAIDDQTAIKVTNGTLEIVSEGHWKLFAP